MPIPFSDVEEYDQLGSAAFLKLSWSADDTGCLGALFVVSARGEPLEFGYNRVGVPQPYLWRHADLVHYTERRLASSLLSVCSRQPRLLLCLGREVSTRLFGQNLQLELPVGRVGERPPAFRRVDADTGEVLEEQEPPPDVEWQPATPTAGSVEWRLFEHMRAHGLLLEPFDRAAVGLQEVYGSEACQSRT